MTAGSVRLAGLRDRVALNQYRAPIVSAALLLLAAGIGLQLSRQSSLAATIAVALVCLAVVLVRPDTASPLAVGLIYSNAAVVAADFHGLPQVIAAGLPVLLLLPIAHRLVIRREPVIVTSALPLLIVYLLVQIAASAFASADVVDSLDELSLYASQGLVLYILITNAVYSVSIVRYSVWALLAVGALLGAIAIYQQVTGTHDNIYFGFAQTDERGLVLDTGGRQLRAAGPIGDPNFFAQSMAVLLPLGLMRILGERRRMLRLAALIATGLIVGGVVMTFSRGAFIGIGFMVLGLIVLRHMSMRQVMALGLAGLMVTVLMPGYVLRLASLEGALAVAGIAVDDDTDDVLKLRANNVGSAVLVFMENPLLGVGPGRFADVYRDYADRVGGIVGEQDFAAHSLVPEIGSETGIVGLVVFGSILLVTMRDLYRARSRLLVTRPEVATLATGFLLSLLVYLGTSISLHLSYQRFFWTLMALAGATAWVLLRERVDEPAGSPATGEGRARRPRPALPKLAGTEAS